MSESSSKLDHRSSRCERRGIAMRGRRQFVTVAAAVGLWLAWTGLSRGIATARAQGGVQHTVIGMDLSATGFFDRRMEFNWSLDEGIDPSSVEIRPGQSGEVKTTLKVVRSLKTQTDQCGMHGQILVGN